MGEGLAILLISGSYERAHYAFMLAAGGAAMGRAVTLFATNEGCRGLLRDWSGLAGAERDAAVRAAGVAGLDELREAAGELGVRLLACEAGLIMAGVEARALMAGVEVAGIPTLLQAGSGATFTL